ncbi:MAG: 16S rRNA (guanine(966)-N(2))-methyltransferase RsmD [Deltaproteobacteria bacterium]
MIRVITGRFKGRMLKAPDEIRPTEDRVKKALFDILDPEGSDVLELFAGSGSVGIEALSRAAASVTFVEKARPSLHALEENLRLLFPETGGKAPGVEVYPKDVAQMIPFFAKNGRKFDIIFLDPPYYKGEAEKTLQMLGQYDILHHSGFVIVQHFKRDVISEATGDLTAFRQARYGDGLLSFYKKSTQYVQKGDLPGDI